MYAQPWSQVTQISQAPPCAAHHIVKLHGVHQGWEFTHRSFPQIAQDKWATVSESLMSKDQP